MNQLVPIRGAAAPVPAEADSVGNEGPEVNR